MKNLASILSNNNILVNKSSYYFNVNNSTVRVSNHLPNRSNWENNENLEEKVFIFINENNDLTDSKIENYLLNEFGKEVTYFLFDTENEAMESINYIKNQI
jgi:hypothetical protein